MQDPAHTGYDAPDRRRSDDNGEAQIRIAPQVHACEYGPFTQVIAGRWSGQVPHTNCAVYPAADRPGAVCADRHR